MKRIINTLLISVASVLLFSCNTVMIPEIAMNEAIVIDLSSGVTKAGMTVEDSPAESFVSHLDVFIFADNAGEPSALEYYGRYDVDNASRITIGAQRSEFAEGKDYHIYLIANSSIPSEDFVGVTYNQLLNKKQEDRLLHLTGLDVDGAPEFFLMDADLGAVVLNDGNPANSTELNAELKRAAAKIVINITADDDHIEFKTFESGSDGGLYYIRNLPYNAYLLAGARPDDAVVADVLTTGQELDPRFTWNPSTDEGKKKVTLTTYAYPNSWTEGIINHETCVIMNLPLIYTSDSGESKDHHNSWYKIHVTGEKVIRRNNYYTVNVRISRPGAISETVPEVLEDLRFTVRDWGNQEINVGGNDRPSYLQLNTDHVDMYNVNTDDTSLEFASSSPITSIVLDRAYYVNYLGQEVEVSTKNQRVYNAISATADSGLNGGITIFSPFVAGDGFSEDSHSNAIRYMTFTVTNQDGKKQTFTVNQYPTLYITHEMGHYSYRSDFQGTNINGIGTENISGASWTGNGWSYNATASSSVFFGSKVALGSEGNYTINYAYWRTSGSGRPGSSSSTELVTSRFNGLNNPRMYHIHVTATSSKYIVARPRMDGNYTDSSAENALLVSPSFMAASQLGATQQLSGGIDQAKAHCEQYIEVTADGVEYSDWRLPTAAEIDIIIAHQEVSDAMATILTEGAYYCAYNPDDGTYTRKTGKSSSTTPVRCVRDAY